MIVPDELPCFISRIGKTQSVDSVVQSTLQQEEKNFSRNPLLSVCFFKGISELAFKKAV
jgi:hypothetical protein